MANYDALYVQFIYYFNVEQDFFECHEVMEELWLEEGRSPLYQGLLQVAVGLHHHGNDNVSGAIKLFRAGIEKLTPYLSQDIASQLGMNVHRFVSDAEHYVMKLERDGSKVPFVPFSIEVTDDLLQHQVTAVEKK